MEQVLTVALIARDEERHIGAALASVEGLADRVLVLLDERTTDRTAAICEAVGAEVVTMAWRGFPAQRNAAIEHCRTPWVLFLDGDERVTPELVYEVRTLLRHEPTAAGYTIPRQNLFFGKIIKGGGWYPDRQLRLLRCDKAHYDEQRLVHELVILDGPTGELQHHLLHINIERFGEFWRKQHAYALQEAKTLHGEGRRARLRNFVGAPAREFYRRYVQLGGWRDGALGILLCGALAWFEVVKFGHLKRGKF